MCQRASACIDIHKSSLLVTDTFFLRSEERSLGIAYHNKRNTGKSCSSSSQPGCLASVRGGAGVVGRLGRVEVGRLLPTLRSKESGGYPTIKTEHGETMFIITTRPPDKRPWCCG